MKNCLLLLMAIVLPFVNKAQDWTKEQMATANTAAAIATISDVEREAITYINLARLYPQQFAAKEVEGYSGLAMNGRADAGTYKQTLLSKLNGMQAVPALTFDGAMYDEAKCFAIESGKSGKTGHEHKKCKEAFLGECCSYGMETGKDIALQWLIDAGTTSLGHRKICLSGEYGKVGIGTFTHTIYKYCAVADFTK